MLWLRCPRGKFAFGAALGAQTSVMAGSIPEGLKPASLGFMITGTSLGPAFLDYSLVAAAALFVLVPRVVVFGEAVRLQIPADRDAGVPQLDQGVAIDRHKPPCVVANISAPLAAASS